MPKHWRALRYLVGTTARAHPLLAAGALLDPVGGLSGTFAAIFVKQMIDALVAADRAEAVRAAVIAGAVTGVAYLLGWTGSRRRMALSQRMGHLFERQAAAATASVPGLEHLENPEHLDQHQLVTQGAGALGQAINELLNIVSWVVKAVAPMVVLVTVSPWLLLLLVLGLPVVWTQTLVMRWWTAAQNEAAPIRRRATHLRSVLASPAGGKELRVFGLGDEIETRQFEEELRVARIFERMQLKLTPIHISQNASGVAAFLLGVGFTLWLAIRGEATVGEVALAVSLAGGAPFHLVMLVQEVGRIAQQLFTVSRLLWLLDYADEQRARFSGTTPPPDRLTTGIVLKDVSFRYPGTDRWVLRNLSCTLDAGSVTAVVGDNGAGKTTLVKLLCRFYDPDEGRILVDGVDLRELDIEAWRQRLTMANQDFARLELLARETVGVGNLPFIDDEAAVLAAVDRAGGTDVIERLNAGLSTQLGRQWEGGTDLSMGQWQKLALARGLMREAPLLQLFDEPTASLDAGTEHALFERLTSASTATATRERGAVTVLVSHRFSTVRAADRILVIDEGQLVENGTHAELVRASGLYAELYEIQAAAYR